jgi:hypothetical protein
MQWAWIRRWDDWGVPNLADHIESPDIWCRALAYGVSVVLPIAVMFAMLLPFLAVLERMDAKGDLPQLTRWAYSFVRLNSTSSYAPAVIACCCIIATAEIGLRAFCRSNWNRLGIVAWSLGVTVGGVVIWLIALVPPMLPVFKAGSGA